MVIDLTAEATTKLKELIATKEGEQFLKIYVAAYGWGGPSFGLALEEPKEDEEVIKTDDFNFVMGKELTEAYGKFTVDYSDNWMRRGFSITPDRGGSTCS